MKEWVDIIVSGGTVLTMDQNGTIIEEGTLAINEEKIVEVRKASEIEGKHSVRER